MEITKEDRILITGGYGFLGRFVFLDLVKNGYYDVHQYGGKKDGYDLGEAAHVGWLFDDIKPDVVIHLAEINGRQGVVNPGGVMFENLNMGLKVLEEARQFDVKKFVTVANYNCYPHTCPVPIKEEDLWSGYPSLGADSYAIAKRTFLKLSESYDRQFGNFDTINLIMSDLYGPSDHFHPHSLKFIANLLVKIKHCIENNTPAIRLLGNPEVMRDFLFIREAARAVRMAMETCQNSYPINIGSGHPISIHEIVSVCCNIMGYSGSIEWTESSVEGPSRRFLDINRAKKEIGFEPETHLPEGLSETIDWVKTNMAEIKTYAPGQMPPRRGYS